MFTRLVTCSVLLAAPLRLAISQSIGSVTLLGGSSTDARGIRSNAMSAVAGASVATGSRSAAWIGANGTEFENSAWSAGLNAAFVARSPSAKGFALTLSSNGGATITSYDATFVTGDAVGAVEYSWRALSVYGGGHASVGTTAVKGQAQLGQLPWVSTLQTMTRSSVAPVYGVQARFAASPRQAVTFWAREDPMRVESERVTDRTGGVTATTGILTVSGAVGRRTSVDENVNFASGALSVALTRFVSMDVSAGRYPSNRFTGASAGKYVNLGFTTRFGAPGGGKLPSPAGVEKPDRGVTRLSISARDASRVELAGDWNDWKPEAALRTANGVWYVDLHLPPGEYRYSFRINGSEWRVPIGTVAVDDGFGGKSAYVTVRDVGATK